jgi:cytochrome c5
MKKTLSIIAFSAMLAACGGSSADAGKTPATADAVSTAAKDPNANPSYDPNRGEGKFTHVEVTPALNVVMADKGKNIVDVKCSSCHKMTSEKLVGQGWAGVTKRHSAEWIMNFITNTDLMINKDPKAQAMLELCLVRMPNQNLSDEEARALYEFMRQNDGVK